MRACLALAWLGLSLAFAACGSDPGVTSDAGAACTSDRECGDGVFCNGTERCVAGASGSSCVSGSNPCEESQVCEEAVARCVTSCPITADADGDGVRAVECGGADCDDSDELRFPGNLEVCDDQGHDEDCDPNTVGARDVDEDGAIDMACCNGDRCGTDCDDANASVHPGQAEVCNGVDDNCEGSVDEGVTRLFFPDQDGDGYGARAGAPIRACALPSDHAENALDCNDARADVAPGRNEVCEGSLDEDCDGTVDEMLAVSIECQNRFGSPPRTAFACSVDGACEVGFCAMGYGDCDFEPSDGCETDLRADPLHCGDCGRSCGVGGSCRDGECDAVVDVEAGATHTCARRAWPDGTPTSVVCWGANDYGQLGDGTTFDRLTPVVVQDLPPAAQLALSPYGSFNSSPYTCALAGGLVYCWGSNEEARLGRGTIGGPSPRPEPVGGTPGTTAYYGTPTRGTLLGMLTVGDGHACVVEQLAIPTSSSWGDPLELRCWGANRSDQIVIGSSAPVPTARAVLGTMLFRPIEATAATIDSACAVFRDSVDESTVTCRGAAGTVTFPPVEAVVATAFQFVVLLEDGTLRYLYDPTVPLTYGPDGPVITDVVQIVAGQNIYCARLDDGRVACGSGPNDFALVAGVDDAIDMSTGGASGYHVCIVRESGGVWCWGSNNDGQCGTGNTAVVDEPTRVVGL
ncbi:MAG: hypothetical protein IPL19_03560 [Sandaracinaceae bacterium]|nr:hypothetical protein [Sandaracinaceae bacterium]MBK8407045.1 hypothetical protein [Sandaracinaceae bacterium]MBP7680538.1 hypothetical protein [Deltaproteobacteria bacterium]